jgi:hypothetical protein
LKLPQIGHTVAAQTPMQPGARDIWIDELAHHRNQVIERQQRHAPQLHCDGLLRGRQRCVELVRSVREIFRALAILPFARRRFADVVAISQIHQGIGRILDLRSGSRRGSGLGVHLAHVVCSALKDSITPRITSLARNSGQLRRGIWSHETG